MKNNVIKKRIITTVSVAGPGGYWHWTSIRVHDIDQNPKGLGFQNRVHFASGRLDSRYTGLRSAFGSTYNWAEKFYGVAKIPIQCA